MIEAAFKRIICICIYIHIYLYHIIIHIYVHIPIIKCFGTFLFYYDILYEKMDCNINLMLEEKK